VAGPLWWAVLALVPLLTVVGGRLRIALVSGAGAAPVDAGLFGVLAILAMGGAGWYPGAGRRIGVAHAGWLVPAALAVMLAVQQTGGEVHLILFGSLGFLGALRFGPLPGLAACAAVAGLDELLQLGVPDRVAEWRDVGLDLLAAAVGVWIARLRFGPGAVGGRQA